MDDPNSNKQGFIYRITNIKNGKKYIGQTIRKPEIRFREHVHSSTKDDPGCRALALAIKAHGADSFKLEVIMEIDASKLDVEEERLIKEEKTLSTEHGYNILTGGRGTHNGHKNSARDQISKSQRKHFDDDNTDLPRYVQYVQKADDRDEGYAVAIPNVKFMYFTAGVLTMQEKLAFALRYLKEENNRENICNEYKNLKRGKRIQNIQKKVIIDNEEYILPAHFMWCPGEKMFLVRKPGKKAKQFGDKRISTRDNYNRAHDYYNN